MKFVLLFLSFCLSTQTTLALSADPARALKNEIVDLAWANMTNEANAPAVRARMEELTNSLAAISPEVTEGRIALYSPGGWRQLWSDERDMSPPGSPARDLSQVYQVVNPLGWGFNFGVRRINPTTAVTFALQVQASVSGNQQTTEITRAYLRSTPLTVGESITELADGIYAGENSDFVARDAGNFPNGPIGARGILTILFIDEDLKIGTSPNVYTGRVEMFVMYRTEVAYLK